MNYLDILIILPLIYGGWRGFKKGFIIELFTLLALLVGIYAGIHFSDYVSNALRDQGVTTKYLPVIAFTITFLGVGAMVFFGGKALEKVIKLVALSPLNKMAGLLFGALKMMYLTGGLLMIVESIDHRNDFFPEDQKNGSLLYKPVRDIAMGTFPVLNDSALFTNYMK